MCFSAVASIGAGVVLTAVGIACIKKTHHSSQLLFASIPLLFGIQQFVEGVIWLTIPNSDYINTQNVFTYFFLFFAQVLWPVYIPLAIMLLEKNATRKNMQKMMVLAGLFVSGYLAYCLFAFNVHAKIVGHHIIYLQDYPPGSKYYVIPLYGLAILLSPFFSHIKHMKIFGTAILGSYVISEIFYKNYFISIWCFFAAILSIAIYFIITTTNAEKPLTN